MGRVGVVLGSEEGREMIGSVGVVLGSRGGRDMKGIVMKCWIV